MDLTIFSGLFRTLDPRLPVTTRVAVDNRSGLIVALGAAAEAMAPTAMHLVSLPGLCQTRGLQDNHTHFLFTLTEGSSSLADLAALPEAERIGEFARRLQEQFDQTTNTVVFTNWNDTVVPAAEIVEVLSLLAPFREVLVLNTSWHTAVASNHLLRRLEPEYQRLNGELKGGVDGNLIHEDFVVQAVARLEANQADLRKRIIERQRLLLSKGITQVFDKLILGHDLLGALVDLSVNGELLLPVRGAIQAWQMREGVTPGRYGSQLEISGLKYFADGAYGNRKARMCPQHGFHYTDGTEGELLLPAVDQIRKDLDHFQGLGGNLVCVHCIGPGAVQQTLAVFEQLLADGRCTSGAGLTLSFEHAETCPLPVLKRVAELQRQGAAVEVCSQMGFTADITDYADRLPENVRAATNPYRTFQQEGIRWTSGTDGPITGDDYFGGMALAVHRDDEEAISVEEAFRVAAGGMLAVGEPFDVIALDGNPFHDPSLLGKVQVLETWVGGRRLWRRQ